MNKQESSKIAKAMLGTRDNIFMVYRSMFKKEPPGIDVLLGSLEKHENMFRCVECGLFDYISGQPLGSDFCQECIDESEAAD